MNEFSKEIKKISGKRKKTDADYETMAKYEFMGSLYCDDKASPIVPSEGIDAIIVSGAKKSKEGQIAKSGVFCAKHSKLKYNGPEKAEDLWNDRKFVNQASVKVNNSRVIRTRPIFPEWSCEVEINYNDEICNEAQVFGWLKVAGEQCGAFDWRPRYGRFGVERIKEQ